MSVNGQDCEPIDVTTGLSQGSPITPVLFAIYIADIHQAVVDKTEDCRGISFVDDVTWVAEGRNLDEVVHKLEKCAELSLVLTTFQTTNRAVRFAHKPNRVQPPQFGSPHEPHRDGTVRMVGGANRDGSPRVTTVRHGSPNLRSPPRFFMVRDIFSCGFHTHRNISSQFSISIYIRAQCFLTVAL